MSTVRDARDTISRIAQATNDLYWSRDEDGHMRDLLKVELDYIVEHNRIVDQFARYVDSSADIYGRGTDTYAMIVETAVKQQAKELQAAWDAMSDAREEAR